jgi:hypothetical protein
MFVALKIDRDFTVVRAELAMTRSEMAVKDLTRDTDKLLKEWRTVVKESHPDSPEVRYACGWMPIVLDNHPLGTFQEALELKNKMEKNSKRQKELYDQTGETLGDFNVTHLECDDKPGRESES